jgi:hypothetical protein
MGDCWEPVVRSWQKYLVVSDADVSYLSFAANAREACDIIVEKSRGVTVRV